MAGNELEEPWEGAPQAILRAPIHDLEPNAPVCVGADTPLSEAIRRMNLVKAGCVLVTSAENRLLGILTERDVLRQVTDHLNLARPVSEVMTSQPQTLGMDDRIGLALNMMHVGGYRHIPVVDEAGEPVGLVSMRDFVRFILSVFEAEGQDVPPDRDPGDPEAV